jgi:hypothetical protein
VCRRQLCAVTASLQAKLLTDQPCRNGCRPLTCPDIHMRWSLWRAISTARGSPAAQHTTARHSMGQDITGQHSTGQAVLAIGDSCAGACPDQLVELKRRLLYCRLYGSTHLADSAVLAQGPCCKQCNAMQCNAMQCIALQCTYMLTQINQVLSRTAGQNVQHYHLDCGTQPL